MGVLIIIAIIFIVFYFSSKASEAKQQRQYKEIERRKLEEKRAAEKLQEQWRQITLQKYTEIARLYPKGLETWNRLHPESTKELIVSNRNKIVEYDRLAKLHFTIPNRNEEEELRKRQDEEAKRRREQEEARRLSELAKYKPDRNAIVKVLQDNGIRCFYHFTARENLSSIKRLGGLYSWFSMQENKRTIPCSGGDDWSHQLDMRHGLQDYVRLSFCDDHPMAYRLKQNGTPLVLLKIDIDVASWKDTQFSDINAADNNHRHGGGLADLNRVNFSAVKRNYVSRDDNDFKPHQAEVMVKTFIPAKYILNLNSPISL